uniref:Uncharacterized protein n=1 Tax=Anguilla anguilla TaxID=7936 RepID=A0A0E9S8V5_ANGAN
MVWECYSRHRSQRQMYDTIFSPRH